MKKLLFIFLLLPIGFLNAEEDYSSFMVREKMFSSDNKAEPELKKNDPSSLNKSSLTENEKSIRVGLLLPLSGKAEKLGEALKNAALMSQFETSDSSLVLQYYDTQGTADGAVNAFNKAKNDGVNIVIGPLFSREVKAITPYANDVGINVLSFTSDVSAIGNGIFSMALLVPQQIERIVSYACTNGSRKFALITRDDEYGKTIADAFGTAVAFCNDAEISGEGYYDMQSNNITDVVKLIIGKKAFLIDNERAKQKSRTFKDTRKISEDGKAINLTASDFDIASDKVPPDFDTIMIADDGTRLRSVAALLSYYDISTENVKIIGTSLWNDPSINKEPSLLKGLFPALDENNFKDFASRYKNLFGINPPRIVSQAYDAVALISTLVQNYETDRIDSAMLTNSGGFLGIDGIFRLNPNGFCERALAVYQIEKRKNIIVSPAPEIFTEDSIFKNYEF